MGNINSSMCVEAHLRKKPFTETNDTVLNEVLFVGARDFSLNTADISWSSHEPTITAAQTSRNHLGAEKLGILTSI